MELSTNTGTTAVVKVKKLMLKLWGILLVYVPVSGIIGW
jgi:hypothetical protein